MKSYIKLLTTTILLAGALQASGELHDYELNRGAQMFASIGDASRAGHDINTTAELAALNARMAKTFTPGSVLHKRAALAGRETEFLAVQAEITAQSKALPKGSVGGLATDPLTPEETAAKAIVTVAGADQGAADFLSTFVATGRDDFAPDIAGIRKDDKMATAGEYMGVSDDLATVIPGTGPTDGTRKFMNKALIAVAIQDVLAHTDQLLACVLTAKDVGIFKTAAVSADLTSADAVASMLGDLVVAQYKTHRATVEANRTTGTPFPDVSHNWSALFDVAEEIDPAVVRELKKPATWGELNKLFA